MHNEHITSRGELLRILYLIKSEQDYFNIAIDNLDLSKVFEPFLKRITEEIIPLVERELPDWAVKIAKKSYMRSGFVIWEEPKPKTCQLCKGSKKVAEGYPPFNIIDCPNCVKPMEEVSSHSSTH